MFLSLCMSLQSQDYISGEFVYNINLDLRNSPFDGMETEEFENTISADYERELIEKILEEARWVFSAMIYGLDVVYSPSDLSRDVDRNYDANLLAEIQFGDPNLEVYDTFLEENIFHLFIRYKLNAYQSRRINYWDSGIFDSVSAYGRYPLYSDDSRINSIKDAIRIALENLLKPEEFNKPSLIEAEVLLRNSPSISIDAGYNRAFVKLRTEIKNVQHYLGNN